MIPAPQIKGVPMTTSDTRRRPLRGKVDFSLMYAVHHAFHRDLRYLIAAVEADQTADPAVRAGWATFKNQLHVHHTAEDTSLWPPLRQKVTRPDQMAVLDAMEAEHARIDPLPARLLYRAVWRPRYARTSRWDTTAARTTTERPGP
jgi:iron-sulfur cluster repair protein YtfE (RIC family)